MTETIPPEEILTVEKQILRDLAACMRIQLQRIEVQPTNQFLIPVLHALRELRSLALLLEEIAK